MIKIFGKISLFFVKVKNISRDTTDPLRLNIYPGVGTSIYWSDPARADEERCHRRFPLHWHRPLPNPFLCWILNCCQHSTSFYRAFFVFLVLASCWYNITHPWPWNHTWGVFVPISVIHKFDIVNIIFATLNQFLVVRLYGLTIFLFTIFFLLSLTFRWVRETCNHFQANDRNIDFHWCNITE